EADFIGASIGASASTEYSNVSAEFLSKDLTRGLDLFSDALLHPIFPQEEVEKVIKQDTDGIKGAKDDPDNVLGSYFGGYLFQNYPYGKPGSGDEVTIPKIKRYAIVKFSPETYTPANTILAVAGDFASADMKKRLEDTFGSWSGAAPAVKKLAPYPPVKESRL